MKKDPQSLFFIILLGEEYGILNSKEVMVFPIHSAALHDFKDGIPAAFVHPFLWKFLAVAKPKGKVPSHLLQPILEFQRLAVFLNSWVAPPILP